MNLSRPQTEELVSGLKQEFSVRPPRSQVVVSPSFPYLEMAATALRGTGIGLAAQNMFWEPRGAYTGEVSAPMLTEVGCGYVIIGHSERRGYFSETDDMIHRKVSQAFSNNLVPIICIGETFEQRQQGIKDIVVMKQLQNALEGLVPPDGGKVVIAYEPVWAVGSGQACDPREAHDTIQVLSQALMDMYHEGSAREKFDLIYGGSVDQSNVAQYVDHTLINGVLVGGASSVLDTFLGIIRAAG